MPVQVAKTPDKKLVGFDFEAQMMSNGFQLLSLRELIDTLINFNITGPMRFPKRPLAFFSQVNGLDIYVFAMPLKINKVLEGDGAWIFVRESGRATYVALQLYQGKELLQNLTRAAKIEKMNAMNRPRCPEKGCIPDFMGVAPGRILTHRRWRCPKYWLHTDRHPVFSDWYINLSPEDKEFLDSLKQQKEAIRRLRKR